MFFIDVIFIVGCYTTYLSDRFVNAHPMLNLGEIAFFDSFLATLTSNVVYYMLGKIGSIRSMQHVR